MTVEIDGANNIVKTNTISEVTSANGVTVDGLNIKDSKLVTANSVIQTNITDQAINEAKMQISNAPTNGYALTAQSGNTGGMTWASVGGGKINQVLQTVKRDTFSTTSTSDFDITGMSINITPSASNSKILILANLNSSASDYRQAAWISVVRNSTQIYRGDADGSRRRATWGYGDAGSNQDEQKYTTNLMAFQYLDSPNTVSQVTYKLAAIIDAYTFYVNRTAEDGNSVTYARVPSSITAMEVLA